MAPFRRALDGIDIGFSQMTAAYLDKFYLSAKISVPTTYVNYSDLRLFTGLAIAAFTDW